MTNQANTPDPAAVADEDAHDEKSPSPGSHATVSTHLYPKGGLDILSRDEVARLRDASASGMHELLKRCALAVLTTGSTSDDPRAAAEIFNRFDIEVTQQDRGLRIDLHNAPAQAFVDGEIIRGVAELVYAVVRDLAYAATELGADTRRDLNTTAGLTDSVFDILRNARSLCRWIRT